MVQNEHKINPFQTMKQIWLSAWQSIFQGEKRVLPVALIGYTALLAVIFASFAYLNATGEVQSILKHHTLSFSMIQIVLMLLFIILVLNFVIAALITRAYAWLHQDKSLADKTWHNAKKTGLMLFYIHAGVLFVELCLQYLLTTFGHHLPTFAQVLVGILSILIYLTVFSLPFLMYTAIVIEHAPLSKALTQGITLLKSSWAATLMMIVVGLFLPTAMMFSLLRIPGLNIVVSLIILFGYYPFMLIVIAFANIFIYELANKIHVEKIKQSGMDAKKA
jgi:hypothetical protein